MKKVVNGRVVDIDNMELFEKAAEGIAVNKSISNSTVNTIKFESDLLTLCVSRYEAFYRAMPYPLYAIECNAKYAAIAEFICKSIKVELKMWVNEALFIALDPKQGIVLKMVARTWAVIKEDCDKHDDNANLENFTREVGYAEYTWILMRILERQTTGTFYESFMGKFMEACNNEPLIIKWELARMLEFGDVPEPLKIGNNKISDLDDGAEYIIDIYTSGLRPNGEEEVVFSIGIPGKDIDIKPKMVRTYNYDTYQKLTMDEADKIEKEADKLQRHKLAGFMNLFQTLSSIKIANESPKFEEYTGFIAERNMVYEINNRVFVCKAYRFVETKEIARAVKIYGYNAGMLYLIKRERIAKNVYKEQIYSYALNDGTLRLCKIQYAE